MPRGRKKLDLETLLARGTFEQRKQGDRLEPHQVKVERPPIPTRPMGCDYQSKIPIKNWDELIEAHYEKTVAEAVADVRRDLSKRYAQRWAWNASDELALRNGCRFDLKRAMHFAYTLRNNLCLWEGPQAGEPLILRFWEPECLLRIFGWVRPDPQYGWVRRFSRSAIWIPKKNGKSPMGAATAIYCWRYDGIWRRNANEPHVGGGQHVYCIAKNGVQAGIVWRHAYNMLKHSPVTKVECDLDLIGSNLTRSQLEYREKLSILGIITGDSETAIKAAEGKNGNCIVCDEAHVVDERMVNCTTDFGASQVQPLWFQISTFGNTEGYGKKDLEYGKRVEAGDEEDDAMFFKSYDSPEDLPDSRCGDEDVWKACNPCYGYTVSRLQMEHAWNRAKNDPEKLAGFKQRRINIWQRVANPMFSYPLWEQAVDDRIDWPHIQRVGGGMGLDLAASEDWCALSLAWEDDGDLCAWIRMWCTEEWINDNGHLCDCRKWSGTGDLHVHDGAAIDFDELEDEIFDILKWTRCQVLGYDRTFGMTLAQSLRKRLPRVRIEKFGQAVENYAKGTADFKAALRSGRFRHAKNAAWDWQAGHVKSKKIGEWEKPIKDEQAPHKKVDGIQALCMAVDVKQYAPARSEPWVGRA